VEQSGQELLTRHGLRNAKPLNWFLLRSSYMPSKIIITTSHRPTPRTRSLVKDLVSVIPNAVRITRGKATLDLLALQAVDIGADRILVIRNWKGNPRFLDFYEVLPATRKATKICTLVLRGYKLARECGHPPPPHKPASLILSMNDVVSRGIDECILECLVRGLRPSIATEEVSTRNHAIRLVIDTKTVKNFRIYELRFSDPNGKEYGPVLRIWKAKMYTLQS